MIFRQENDHSVLRNFWHKGTVRGMTAASPWGAGSFFRTRGTSEEAAKKAVERRLGDEGKASLRPSREMGRDDEEGSTACRFLPERGMSGGGIR